MGDGPPVGAGAARGEQDAYAVVAEAVPDPADLLDEEVERYLESEAEGRGHALGDVSLTGPYWVSGTGLVILAACFAEAVASLLCRACFLRRSSLTSPRSAASSSSREPETSVPL